MLPAFVKVGMSSLPEALSEILELGPRGLARFEASLDPDWIHEALAATGTASVRRRKFPAEQAIWLVIGMALFADRPISAVVEHLGLVLPGKGSLSPGSVVKARDRLGPEPLRFLFEKVAAAWAAPASAHRWRGLALLGIDGTHLRVQDSDNNYAHFGKPSNQHGDAGYPQLRLATLVDLSSRLLLGAEFGPFAVSENKLASGFLEKIPAHTLTIVDRGFYAFNLIAALIGRGDNRHVLARVRNDVQFTVLASLPDGSQHVRVTASREAVREKPELPRSFEGRLISYQLPGGEPSRLFTDLLDTALYPADELVPLYHERWEVEIAYDELKTHMLERQECLRSLSPERVQQEVWGLLLTYNLVRREMAGAAQLHDVPPQRISFSASLLLIRNVWVTAWHLAPGTLPRHLADLRTNLKTFILPPRRSDRRHRRHVKIKVSPFPRNRGRRPASKAIGEPSEDPK